MSFKNAVVNQMTTTTNGMVARVSTADANLDLFFKAGAMRGQDIIPVFSAAYAENPELALRIAQWLRDARGGAGERQLFRQILVWLEKVNRNQAFDLMRKIPEIGRWDDLLVLQELQPAAFAMIAQALADENGLCAKWMPRQGAIANKLAGYMGLTARNWRKMLVRLTSVVEQQMCAKEWDSINFEAVPSLASARYSRAFARNSTTYAQYVELLQNGKAKVNAGVVYPYQVIQTMENGGNVNFAIEQWNALPNFVGNFNMLPMVDVSGSMMSCPVGGNKKLTCMSVAVSLGLYLADKNTGPFNGLFLTFSKNPQMRNLQGNLYEKYSSLSSAEWGYNTDIVKAFEKILEVALQHNVPQEEMPKYLVILSDMQFDASMRQETAMDVVRELYVIAGYEVPVIVFWNLNAHDNVPVKFDEKGTVLISGFSPAIMKAVLSMDMEHINPMNIMLSAINIDRYDIDVE